MRLNRVGDLEVMSELRVQFVRENIPGSEKHVLTHTHADALPQELQQRDVSRDLSLAPGGAEFRSAENVVIKIIGRPSRAEVGHRAVSRMVRRIEEVGFTNSHHIAVQRRETMREFL